jgi:hypothetical protein
MLLNRNRSELHFSSSYERLICSEELGSRHQTPTLIGCMLLTIPQASEGFHPLLLAVSAAISEALDYDRFFEALSSCFLLFRLRSALVARLAAVISEALDSIPTFDRPSNRRLFSLLPSSSRFRARRHQRSPRL